MNPIAQQFLDRIRDARESTTGSLGRLSHWLEKHTTLNGRPYSFRDHEFQRDIIDDKSTTMVVLKSSQVGLSEVSARMTLGLLATNASCVAIYGLQTVAFSSRFTKSRIDPIIAGSPTLSAMTVSASDSASFKQFNNGAQLHGAGLSHGISVISVPAWALVVDELDFCDPQSVATAESRLSHSSFYNEETGVRGIRRFFSTPTVPDYGVSKLFDQSNQRQRLVKCRHCSEWFWPNLLEQGVVDGWDRAMVEITAVDVMQLEERGLLHTARLLCPSCHGVITAQNLGPDRRAWVAKRPGVTRVSGWQVSPFDLPAYHTVETLLRKLVEFGDSATNHWYNFALGIPYANSLNSVVDGIVAQNTVVTPITPEQAKVGGVGGCVVGLDVGKISWIVIGKVIDKELHILWVEQIRLRTEDGSDLEGRVLELLRAYRVVVGIMDALPYTDTILRIIAQYPAIRAAEYSIRDKTLPMMVAPEDSDIAKMNRGKTISYLVRRVNSGQVKFPRINETAIVAAHLRALRQVERIKENGEVVQEWVSTGPDHYGHALNYCNMAAQSLMDTIAVSYTPPTTIRQARPGSRFRPMRAA